MPDTKGGHPSDDAQSRVWHPTLLLLTVLCWLMMSRCRTPKAIARLLGLNMSADCHQNYGAPSQQCDRRRPTWFAASPCLRGAVTWQGGGGHGGGGSLRVEPVARRWLALALLRRGYRISHHRWHQCRPSTIRATRPSGARCKLESVE